MVKPIINDVLFLSQPSVPATKRDAQVGVDLLDTLAANSERCVGMAANMIGVNKRIIVVNMGKSNVLMYNPVIVAKSGAFETEEGCLSLIGERPCTRYEEIKVAYQDSKFVKRTEKFTGWTAQIIQHECDHLEGIII